MSTRHGFAFLCMPKCASSSIESAIADHCNINFSDHHRFKHINARDFRTYILGYRDKAVGDLSITTFCLMRDPLDWLFSWFRFRQRPELRDPAHPFHHNYAGNVSFDDFALAYARKGERPDYANLPTECDFLLLENGEIGVDRIYAMERLDLVAGFLSERIGRRIRLPRKNRSPRMPMQLGSAAREALEHYLERDIALYRRVSEAGVLALD